MAGEHTPRAYSYIDTLDMFIIMGNCPAADVAALCREAGCQCATTNLQRLSPINLAWVVRKWSRFGEPKFPGFDSLCRACADPGDRVVGGAFHVMPQVRRCPCKSA